MNKHSQTMKAFLIATSALLISGCKDQETVTTYTIQKEERKAVPPTPVAGDAAASAAQPGDGGTMNALPGMVEQSQQFGAPTFTAPEHWQAQPLGNMRKGSWQIAQDDLTADMSVLVFPGDVGGDLANINRWRQQVGLPAIDAATLAKELTAIPVGAYEGQFITLINPDTGQGIIGAILAKDGATWFFKMIGPAPLVIQEMTAFKQFLAATEF